MRLTVNTPGVDPCSIAVAVVAAIVTVGKKLIAICAVVAFWLTLPSFATTVIRFAPGFSVTYWLQFAVPDPLTVPPIAATPLTVTDNIPLPPVLASLAVPDSVIGLTVVVWLLV